MSRFTEMMIDKGCTAADRLIRMMAEIPVSERTARRTLKRFSEEQPAAVLKRQGFIRLNRLEKALWGYCGEVQKLVLMDILRSSADTEIGREYGFAGMKSVEDFRSSFPVSEYDDYKSRIDRMAEGEEDILFPGKATIFLTTSGTSGEPKLVPVSRKEETARLIVLRSRYVVMLLLTSVKSLRRIFAYYNIPTYGVTEGGIPVGKASGKTLNTGYAYRLRMKFMSYTPALLEELEGDAADYTIMRLSIAHRDVSFVIGNNALRFARFAKVAAEQAEDIIRDIRNGTNKYALSEKVMKAEKNALKPDPERADELEKLLYDGRFSPKHYWKNITLASFWLGSSVGAYSGEVRGLLPEQTKYVDTGYGASEAKINIPVAADDPSGPLSIFTGFYEFVPEDGGEPLLAHELKDGETYRLLLTNYAGLFRYDIKDYVRVDGFTGSTPNICFVSKRSDMANIVMEKIPGAALFSNIRDIVTECGLSFVTCQVFTDDINKRYVICIETEGPYADIEDLNGIMDRGLSDRLYSYKLNHETVKLLDSCEVVLMRRGWRDHLVQKYSGDSPASAQLKIPVVIKEPPEEDWILDAQ